MPRASGVSNPPAGAAAAASSSSKNVSRNAGHSGPSCSAPAYQSFHPVTRSMTRVSDPIVASPGFKAAGSASASTGSSISDASFSIQLAASQQTATHARTPLKVTSSGWKPLTEPVALSEERKCASLTTNPTAKRFRFASSRVVKDPISLSAAKANSNVPSGKKYRDEENMSLGDQSDGAVMPSPTKKLQTCKGPSDLPSIRKSTIRILGAKGAAPPPPTGKSQIETGKNIVAPAEVISASTIDIKQSNDAYVPLVAQQLQPDTAKNSSVTMNTHETSNVNQLAATILTLPRRNLQTDSKKPYNVPIMANQVSGLAGATAPLVTPKLPIIRPSQVSGLAGATAPLVIPKLPIRPNQVSGLAGATAPLVTSKLPIRPNQVSGFAGATAPLVTPKLEIGNVKDSSNPLSNPAYTRALLIKQQEQLLQQYKLGSSQQHQQGQQLYIRGPALFENDGAPPIEPLGTRCQLCKVDVAFRPQGIAGGDANAPPVVAVLACHHVFHSSCIESVYGLAEPVECLACLEPGAAH